MHRKTFIPDRETSTVLEKWMKSRTQTKAVLSPHPPSLLSDLSSISDISYASNDASNVSHVSNVSNGSIASNGSHVSIVSHGSKSYSFGTKSKTEKPKWPVWAILALVVICLWKIYTHRQIDPKDTQRVQDSYNQTVMVVIGSVIAALFIYQKFM